MLEAYAIEDALLILFFQDHFMFMQFLVNMRNLIFWTLMTWAQLITISWAKPVSIPTKSNKGDTTIVHSGVILSDNLDNVKPETWVSILFDTLLN